MDGAPKRWDLDRLKRSAEGPAKPSTVEGQVIGRYRLVRAIAAGAMGAVYEADDAQLKRRVALKVLHDVHDGSETLRHRFEREAVAAAALSHPNVLQVYDAGEADGKMFLAMELVKGGSLKDAMALRGGDPRPLLAMLVKAARGLAAAHEAGIVHRDVKPANILVDAAGEPKVGDFGLAHLSDSKTELTRSGTPLGTPLYMAPEQVRGDRARIGPATDVYGLGVILYEILAGRPPHSGETTVEIYNRIISEDPVPPRRVNSRIATDVETICLKALAHEPRHRYPTARDFADDLQRYLAGEAIQARPPSMSMRASRWIGRHRAASTGALMAAVFIAVGSGWAFVLKDRDRDRAASEKLFEIGRTMLDRAAKESYRRESEPEQTLKRAAEAQKKIEEALAAVPGSALGHYLLGLAGELQDRDDLAEAEWRRTIAIDPAFGPAHFRLGRMLLMQAFIQTLRAGGDRFTPAVRKISDEAVLHIDTAMREGSGFDDAMQRDLAEAMSSYVHDRTPRMMEICRRAIVEYEGVDGVEEFLWLGSTVQDEEHRMAGLDLAIARRPWYPIALFSRALAHVKAGDPDRAIADYDAAIRASPNFAIAWSNRGASKADRGDVAGALADYDEAIRIDPAAAEAYNNRGNLNYGRDWAKALADFSEALRIDPTLHQSMCNRSDSRLALGDPAGALADAEGAIALKPDYPNAHLARGAAKAALGDAAAALQAFDQALRLDPGYARALAYRATLKSRGGDLAGALADYDASIALDPKAPFSFSGRGAIHLKQGRLDASIEDYTRAIGLWPGSAGFFNDRGYALYLKGDRARASADVDEAIRLDPKLGMAWLNRAVLRQGGADPAGAAEDLKRAIELLPAGSPMRAEAERMLSGLGRREH